MNPSTPDPNDSTQGVVTETLMRHLEVLRQPTTTQQRLDLLAELTTYWYGPPAPKDGLTEAELKEAVLPMPLRWWFARYGRRKEILQCPNYLLPLDDSEADDDGRLIFYIEEQAVYLWATTSEGEDPPVWVRENEDEAEWESETDSLSGFLIQAVLLDGIFNAPYSVRRPPDDRILRGMPGQAFRHTSFGREFKSPGAFPFSLDGCRTRPIRLRSWGRVTLRTYDLPL